MILKACEDHGSPKPEWRVSGGDFWAIFHFAYPNEMADLKVGTRVTDQVTDEISRLLTVIQGEMTRGELQICLGLKHLPHFRDAYLRPALNAGFIEMTIPDKPNSRLQRYRLTELGNSLIGNVR